MKKSDSLFQATAPTSRTDQNGNGAPLSIVVAPRRGARVHVRTFAEVKEKFEWCAKELDTTECPLFEAMVEAVYECLRGKAQSVLVSKDTYLFADITIQRLTYRMVRAMKGSQIDSMVAEEVHGSPQKCYSCDSKPVRKYFLWTARDHCHTFYLCQNHKPQQQCQGYGDL